MQNTRNKPSRILQGKKEKETKRMQEEMIISIVHRHRRRMPKLGVKKLYKLMKEDFERMNIKLGRDKFFKILGRNGLLVHRKKRYAKTTNSRHRFSV